MALCMGILWFGSITLYGISTTKLGSLGAALGWPLFMSAIVISSTLAGAYDRRMVHSREGVYLHYGHRSCLPGNSDGCAEPGRVMRKLTLGSGARWAKKVVRRSCGYASQAEFISLIGFTWSVSKADSITATTSETVVLRKNFRCELC